MISIRPLLPYLLLICSCSTAFAYEKNADAFEVQSRAQIQISSEYKSSLLKFILSENTASRDYTACHYSQELENFHQYQSQNIDHHIYAHGNAVMLEDDLKLVKSLIEKYKIACTPE